MLYSYVLNTRYAIRVTRSYYTQKRLNFQAKFFLDPRLLITLSASRRDTGLPADLSFVALAKMEVADDPKPSSAKALREVELWRRSTSARAGSSATENGRASYHYSPINHLTN